MLIHIIQQLIHGIIYQHVKWHLLNVKGTCKLTNNSEMWLHDFICIVSRCSRNSVNIIFALTYFTFTCEYGEWWQKDRWMEVAHWYLCRVKKSSGCNCVLKQLFHWITLFTRQVYHCYALMQLPQTFEVCRLHTYTVTISLFVISLFCNSNSSFLDFSFDFFQTL